MDEAVPPPKISRKVGRVTATGQTFTSAKLKNWAEMEKMPKAEYPDAPQDLTPSSRALWAEFGPAHATNLRHRMLLHEALLCIDRVAQLRKQIADSGLIAVTTRTKMARQHPGVKLEAELLQRFYRLWNTLGIEMPNPMDTLKERSL